MGRSAGRQFPPPQMVQVPLYVVHLDRQAGCRLAHLPALQAADRDTGGSAERDVMIPGAIAQLSAVFNRRFLFNALLPTLVFISLLGAVVVADFSSFTTLTGWWTRLDVLSKASVTLVYAAAMWFLAAAVASQWRGIVRLFEGYPAMRILAGRVPGTAWHTAHRRRLWVGVDEEDIEPDPAVAYYRYPLLEDEERDEEDVLPTTLGNILLAGERYPALRYGMDAIIFWPRLYPLLPEPFRTEYQEYVIDYEFPLVVAFLATATGWTGGLLTLLSGGHPLLFLGVFGGGNLAGYLAYRLSLSSAEEVAEQQRSAFDLYRDALLDQWPTPLDVQDERAAFTEIEEFIIANTEPSWAYAQQRHRRRRHRAEPES
jgi:hypothetical protein